MKPFNTTTPQLRSAFARAFASLLRPRMLWLTALPFLLSMVISGGVLWLLWSQMHLLAHEIHTQLQVDPLTSKLLVILGAFGIHLLTGHLLALVLFVPALFFAMALLMLTGWGTPVVLRYLAREPGYVHLQKLHGGSWLGSIALMSGLFLLCLLLTLFSLLLLLLPPVFALAQIAIWGWFTYRVGSYDALALHASKAERHLLQQRYRWPLLGIGMAITILGMGPIALLIAALPLGLLFPLAALFAAWLYVALFIFSILWYGYFCLDLLVQERGERLIESPPLMLNQ